MKKRNETETANNPKWSAENRLQVSLSLARSLSIFAFVDYDSAIC